jgi:phospholipase/carboxylesterase
MTELALHHITRDPRQGPREGAPMLVLLHGVRSNEQDLIGLAPALDPRFFIVSARAPLTLGPGAYGWYHVEFTPTGYIIDEDEAEAGRAAVLRFIDELVSAYPVDRNRVYLMGFSQGCIMSLSAALSQPRSFAGAVGMSGRLLDRTLGVIAPKEELNGLPLMVVHGTRDPVIPIEYGRAIRDQVGALPVDLTYREYEMAHHVTDQSMADIHNWLKARLDSGDWRTGRA